MQYRKFGSTGVQLSALGFGAMRLPKDEDEAIQVIRHSLDLGVNYVDTALAYIESESIVGKAIKDRRGQVYLSTKNPLQDNTGAGWWSRLEQSLENLKTDYIDFYQVVHDMRWKGYTENFSLPGAGLDMARKAKEQGIIRHICISSHDTPENMRKLIDTGEFEGITLQYNLLDRGNEEIMAYMSEKGMGVFVMGPVAGGRLVAPSQAILKMIPTEVKNSAEVALRFVLSNPHVTCAISGMNTIEMVEENAAIAGRTETLSDFERQRMDEALVEVSRLSDLYCTGCDYCMPCPNDVNISANFRLMNLHRIYGLTDYAKRIYAKLGSENFWIKGLKAEACVECGECEPKCPQNIPIVEQLKETADALGS